LGGGEVMRLEICLDYNGRPYIELLSQREKSAEDQLLEYFIREAKYRGIKFVNEANPDTRNDYATIRLKEREVKND
jgi:hypothetical protein